MNKITIDGRAGSDDLPDVAVGINIQISFSDDAPATLVQVIGRNLAELLTAWGRDEELQKIAQECEAIRARHQRQADHAAEMLIGDADPEPEPALARAALGAAPALARAALGAAPALARAERAKERAIDLPAAIAHQFCHACGDAYGCRAVSGCSECQAVRDALPGRVRFGEGELK